MVYLSRIYTKTGDDGDTALGDGTRVPKDDPRVEAYGSVDELNSVLGLLVLAISAQGAQAAQADTLKRVQNDLFDLGADLCCPETDDGGVQRLRIQASQVAFLEQSIDRLNAELHPLTSFVLPGGTPAAAWAHFARTVCRRAERTVVGLSRVQRVNPQSLIYLNRLSDLLFVLARWFNSKGTQDVLWEPGLGQS